MDPQIAEIIPGGLFQSGRPYWFEPLLELGVSVLVNVGSEPDLWVDEWQARMPFQVGGGRSPAYLHHPLVDGSRDELDVAGVDALTHYVLTALDDARRVLVHCDAGVNRSALICAEVLCRHNPGLTGRDAVDAVRRAVGFALVNEDFVEFLLERYPSGAFRKDGGEST
ncbi:MAG: dual specificity protein phosphatase family protein [Gemmatimonadetes bacterium]|nr:dual specificity protein phosphatase family protein [Gemmatimonadota bacterium]